MPRGGTKPCRAQILDLGAGLRACGPHLQDLVVALERALSSRRVRGIAALIVGIAANEL